MPLISRLGIQWLFAVLPSKGSVGKYAVAELQKLVLEIGRTFGIVQYDKQAPLKTMAHDQCRTIGGLSMGAVRLRGSMSSRIHGTSRCRPIQFDGR